MKDLNWVRTWIKCIELELVYLRLALVFVTYDLFHLINAMIVIPKENTVIIKMLII